MEQETCCLCDAPTGKAGRSDDSIYHIIQENFHNYVEGDEIGPLCDDCNDVMIHDGFKFDPIEKGN